MKKSLIIIMLLIQVYSLVFIFLIGTVVKYSNIIVLAMIWLMLPIALFNYLRVNTIDEVKGIMMTTKKTKHVYINQCIGLVLREFRKCKGLSGAELAKLVGLSQQQISRYESGKNQVTLYMLFEILMVLDVSIEKFILELKKMYITELDHIVMNPEAVKNKIVSLF